MLVVCLMLLCSLAMAPEVKAEMEAIETPRSGLEFQVGSDFQLASFSGSMISWKRLSSEHRGWRVGLSPSVTNFSNTGYIYDEWSAEYEEHLYSLDVVVQKLFFGSLHQNTRSFWGLGPLAGFSYSEIRESRFNPDGELDRESAHITRRWNFGGSVIMGVEYFFLPNISLHGEYGFDFVYQVSNYSGNDSQSKYFTVHSRAVRLGLCVLY